MKLKHLLLLAGVVIALVIASLLGGFRKPSAKAEHYFTYCLGAAHPASAEAIDACRKAAESISGGLKP